MFGVIVSVLLLRFIASILLFRFFVSILLFLCFCFDSFVPIHCFDSLVSILVFRFFSFGSCCFDSFGFGTFLILFAEQSQRTRTCPLFWDVFLVILWFIEGFQKSLPGNWIKGKLSRQELSLIENAQAFENLRETVVT